MEVSPDYESGMKSKWKVDIIQVNIYDVQRAYGSTGAVTECGPYKGNNAQG
jgi:hypothetical protein